MLKKVSTKNAFLGIMLLVAAMVTVCGGCGNLYRNIPDYTRELPSCDFTNASYEDKDILINIKPLPESHMAQRQYYDRRIRFFALTITNKTARDISLDWSKVYYLNKDGQPDGGFMLEGESYSQRNYPKQPLLVLANNSRTVNIYPDRLVYYSLGSWSHSTMEEGTFGLYTMLTVRGQEKRIKVTVDIGESRARQHFPRR